jgi:exonuclease III
LYDVYESFSKTAKLGSGLLVAVRKHPAYYTVCNPAQKSDYFCIVDIVSAQHKHLLSVGICYIPPEGSKQLQTPHPDLHTRYGALEIACAAAIAKGPLVLTGDFNADVHNPTRRVHHVQALQDMCSSLDLVFCDTKSPLVPTVLPSFFPSMPRNARRTAATPSRLDYCLVSASHSSLVLNSAPFPRRADSDHAPLFTDLRLDLDTGAHVPSGHILPKVLYDAAENDRYVACLQAHLMDAEPSTGETVSTMCKHIMETAMQAAAAAGMKVRRGRKGRTRSRQQRRVDAPWYDAECAKAKQEYYKCIRAGNRDDAAKWERAHHSRCRALKRNWARAEALRLLQNRQSHPSEIFRMLRASAQLPAPLADPAVWLGFAHKLAAPPQHIACGATFDTQVVATHEGDTLNSPISDDEVLSALNGLANGKAAGPSGCPAELWKYARFCDEPSEHNPKPVPRNVLLKHLTALLNLAFASGQVPSQWNTCVVTPLFKHGKPNPCDTNNYRPIAVGDSLAKLYASVLNKRLTIYVESKHIRNPAQAGNRRALSTIHQIFALQHLIDKTQVDSPAVPPLYIAVLDVESAFNTAQHELMWKRLHSIGVHGRMLGAVQSLYAGYNIRIQAGGLVGEQVPVQCGVKQGCPLSPLLFGLLVDGLWSALQRCAASGVQLEHGWPVTDLDYVDDLIVLSNSEGGLQNLLSTTHSFFNDIGMRIHAGKTFVMVFHHPQHYVRPPCMYLGSQRLQVEQECKYLGLTIRSNGGFMGGLDTRESRAQQAWGVLKAKYNELGIAKSVGLQVDLYKAYIIPLITYGCEVWAFHPAAQPSRDALCKVYMQHLACICGTTPKAPHPAILAELRMPSFDELIVIKAAKFWNSLWELPRTSLHRAIAEDNVLDAYSSYHTPNAFKHICAWYANHAVPLAFSPAATRNAIFHDIFTHRTTLRSPPAYPESLSPLLSVSDIERYFQLKSASCWQNRPTPRLSPSEGAMFSTYAHYMLLAETTPAYYTLHLPPHMIHSVLRFRLGTHQLPIRTGRMRKVDTNGTRLAPVPRMQRICPKCTSGIVGDEWHMIFECSHLHDLRAQYSKLFTPHMTMKEFFSQSDQHAIVRFVYHALYQMTV